MYSILFNFTFLVAAGLLPAMGDHKKEILEVRFKTSPPEKLYLYSFHGVIATRIDSSSASTNDHMFRFYGNKATKRGFYRVYVNDTNYVDLILSSTEKVKLVAEDVNLKKQTAIYDSRENEGLWQLKKKRQRYLKEKKELTALYNDIKHRQSHLLKALDSLEKDFNVFAYHLLNENEGTYFSLTNRIILSPVYTDSSLLADKYKNDTSRFLRDNFFNNIDFSNPELINSTLLPNQYLKYFGKYVPYDEDGFKTAIDLILTKAKLNNEIYQFTLDFLLKLFDEAGPELIFEYIALNYYENVVCNSSYDKKAGALKLLRPGNAVPDISINCFTPYHSLKDLYSGNKLTLIYFWSSHCNFCVEALPLLLKEYAVYHTKGFEIVGFSLDENKNDWEEFSRSYTIPWYNFNELKGWNSTISAAFAINKTPTYFLVDSNGIILEKKHNFDIILKIIRDNIK